MQLDLELIPRSKSRYFKRPPATYPLDGEKHIQYLVNTKEHMIYLYGQNRIMCFIRDHSSLDDGTPYPINRAKALRILKEKYQYHCNHISHDGSWAKVYIRRVTDQPEIPDSSKLKETEKIQ